MVADSPYAAAWLALSRLASLCNAADIAAAAGELAQAEQRGNPPPNRLRSPAREYLILEWPGYDIIINAGLAARSCRRG